MRNGRGNMRGERGMRNGRGNMRGDRRNMMENMRLMGSMQRILAFESVREKFPAESTELDKAMLETEQKYAELAKKAGVELKTSLE